MYVVGRQLCGKVYSLVVLHIGAIHSQICDTLTCIVIMFTKPFYDISVVGIRVNVFLTFICAVAFVNIGFALQEFFFFVQMPDEEPDRELSLDIIKGFGWNNKISTELRSERFSEITEVGCLRNFQL